jgi:hypothetical protein
MGVGGQHQAPALYPQEWPGTHSAESRVGPKAGLERCGKFRTHGIRSADRPAGSESPYRLSYSGPPIKYILQVINF